jgi:hypothetical protein
MNEIKINGLRQSGCLMDFIFNAAGTRTVLGRLVFRMNQNCARNHQQSKTTKQHRAVLP